MKDVKIVQDNRLTTARYELSLLEKRVMYIIIRDIRNKFVLKTEGNRDLFDNLLIKLNPTNFLQELNETNTVKVRNALKSLRLRSFEWDNGHPIGTYEYEALEVGFINWHRWKRGGDIELEVSKVLLPFLVELTERFTEYSLVVAMTLKSKWSQRLYELCSKWHRAGGFQMTVDELRKEFVLEKKYKKYGALKKYVLDVAHKELKELYTKGQSDLYFEYSEVKKGRSVTSWKFKIISNKDRAKLSKEDVDYLVRTDLALIFDTKNKPKNKEFVAKTMNVLRLDFELMKHCYERLTSVMKMKDDRARYMRYIINEDYLKSDED